MSSLNKVFLIGNLGKDPDVRTLDGGTKMALFSIATSETWKDANGNKKTNTDWHNCVAYKGIAGVIEKYITKGSTIHVEGKIKNSSYNNAKGEKVYTSQVIVEKIVMLSRGNSNNSNDSDDSSDFEDANNDSKPETKTKKQKLEKDDDLNVPF
jgi:single-strand DNA-binding protein